MKARALLFAAFLSIALAACGGSTQVGSGLGTDLGSGKNARLGGFNTPTPTAKASAKQSQPVTAKSSKPAAQKPSVEFVIDQSGYKPYFIQVFVGGIVKVTNKDSTSRSVTAAPNQAVSFDSGLIKPGESWTYTASTPGQFNFGDSTRPYVVGTLKVIAK